MTFVGYLHEINYFCTMKCQIQKLRQYYKTIGCSVLIFILSILPGSALPKIPNIHNFDKVEHFIAYFFLAICLFAERKIHNRPKPLKDFAIPLIYPVGFGILMEILQIFTHDRTPSWTDILANTLGAITAITFFIIITYKKHE
jgi:VanZ family protein